MAIWKAKDGIVEHQPLTFEQYLLMQHILSKRSGDMAGQWSPWIIVALLLTLLALLW